MGGVPKSSKTADGFSRAVEEALERVNDAAWLGRQSPLAAPYFLGAAMGPGEGADPASRGRALRQALEAASQELASDQRETLNASFFKRNPNLNNAGVALSLHKSEATYYRNRAAALDAIASAFLAQVAPPLRREQPAPIDLIGRDAVLTDAEAALRAGGSVSLIGPGGIGKSTLATALSARWPGWPTTVFWHTIRPGLSDGAPELIFALGHFLRDVGAPNTWRQLVADNGSTPPSRALGLLRHDLSTLAGRMPLLIIDEADRLRDDNRIQAQTLRLLEDLRGLAPLLIAGQRMALDTTQAVTLKGLDASEIRSLFASLRAPEPVPDEIERVLTLTRGNPALLRLYAAMRRAGERADALLRQLARAPSLEPLLTRTWGSLPPDVREVLFEIAVFRGAAPADLWRDAQTAIDTLRERELLRADAQGGLHLPAYALDFVLERIPTELKAALHLRAAEAREARGEMTEAAWHYVQAGHPANAVWLWARHLRQERALGRGPMAAALFSQVRDTDLPNDDDRRALALVRAELQRLLGDGTESEAAVQGASWPATHPLTPRARQLLGDALAAQGRLEQAAQSYRDGLDALAGFPGARAVDLRTRLGHLALNRMRDPGQAGEQALLAQIKALEFMGEVDEDALRFKRARRRYQLALALSDRLPFNTNTRWHALGNLGRVCWKMGDLDTSARHLREAIQLSRAAGNVISPLYHLMNLTACHIQAGRHDEALAAAVEGLSLARPLGNPFLIAGLSSNAGEACCHLGRLEEAERYALEALRQEEAAMQPYASIVMGMVQRARGQADTARASFRAALDAALDIQDAYAEAAARRALGEG